MDPKPRSRLLDLAVSKLAARQDGVVSAAQLLALGLTRTMIRTRVRAGRLHAVHRGVYSLSPVLTERARQQAALLACGSGAVLSPRTAAAFWGLIPYPADARPWVTIPPGREAEHAGIVVRRAVLEARDVRRRERLPLTSPPRTVIDLAVLLDIGELESVLAEASYRNLACEAELRDQLARYPSRTGNKSVRRVLGLVGGPQRTRSPGEVALLRFLRRRRFAGFELNAKVHGYEVDCLWREANLAVELDGWDAHKGRSAFERDRLKWAELEAAGTSVMPITGRQLHADEEGLARRLRARLNRSRS